MISQAIAYKKITLLTILVLTLFGVYSYYTSPKQEAPKIEAPIAMITAIYPGASPEDMEKQVTNKIEDKIIEMEDYQYSRSVSSAGIATVTLELNYGVDVDKAWNGLRNDMNEVERTFPEGAEIYQINTETSRTAGIIVSFSSEQESHEDLVSYAEDLKSHLANFPGVAKIDIHGDRPTEVQVKPDLEKLNDYQLTLADLASLIQAQNIELPLGTLTSNDDSILSVTAGSAYKSIDDIKNTVIEYSIVDEDATLLSDIAEVTFTEQQIDHMIKHDNKDAVLFALYFSESGNIVSLGKQIEDEMNEFISELPSTVESHNVLLQHQDVESSINNFIRNLLIGMGLVILLATLSLGIRNSIIISTTIPVVVLLTILAMNLLGIPFHQVSIVALIMALGMFVDNAIVVTNAIQAQLENKVERLKACVDGTREVAVPVFTSTLTTVVAFIPLAMINSIVGEYIYSIPIIIIVSLLLSYIVAVTLTPTLSYIFLTEAKKQEKQSLGRKALDFLLNITMHYKKSTVLVLLVLLGGTVFLSTNLGLQFFPKADKNFVYIDLQSNEYGDIEKTEEFSEEVTQLLLEQPEVLSYTLSIGDGLPKFWDTMWPSVKSLDYAQVLVTLNLDNSDRFKGNAEFTDYVQDLFDERLTKGTATIKELEQGDPVGAPITIRVSGDDLSEIARVSQVIEDELLTIEGTINVDSTQVDPIEQFDIDVDFNKAGEKGITNIDIQNEIGLALGGRVITTFTESDQLNRSDYNVTMDANVTTVKDLEQLQLRTFTGEKVELHEVATVKMIETMPEINKYNQELYVTVSSDVRSGYSSVNIQTELQDAIKDLDLGEVVVTYAGEQESMNDNFSDVLAMGVFAILAIFLVLVIQFNSFLQPFIILLVIPMASIGAITGLFIAKEPLSFTGLLGIVSLFGIVVNNAIVLIDAINKERLQGATVPTACKQAAQKRLRPIMLSTTTTVIGLIPLALLGSDLFSPMAIGIIGGLLVSMFLTLLLIPMFYSLVVRDKAVATSTHDRNETEQF